MKEIKSVEEFKKIIAGKVIVMFTANWCPDCTFIKPFMPEIEKNNSEYTFYSVDRDELLDMCIDLEITGIPSFIAFADGKEIGRYVNKFRKTKEQIQEFIEGMV